MSFEIVLRRAGVLRFIQAIFLSNLWFSDLLTRYRKKPVAWNGLCMIWLRFVVSVTAQKMKFFIKEFFSKCDQIRRNLRIWSHLLKKSLMENFIFCAVYIFWFKSVRGWSIPILKKYFAYFNRSYHYIKIYF